MKKLTQEEFIERAAVHSPKLQILSQYKGQKTQVTCKCKDCGTIKPILAQSVLRHASCTTCHNKDMTKSHDDFLKDLREVHGDTITALSTYTGSQRKMDFRCNVCNGEFSRDAFLMIGVIRHGCPYCAGKQVLIGFNDLWTVRPDIAALLEDQNEGYILTIGSTKRTWFKCPVCSKRLYKKVSNVTANRLVCDCDKFYAPLGERIMIAVLTRSGVAYTHDKPLPWSGRRRYDFCVNDAVICEMMGRQHYENAGFTHRSFDEELANDVQKYDEAIQHGYQYFAIDCSSGNFTKIKNKIIESGLLSTLGITTVDWQQCFVDASARYEVEIASDWNDGMRMKDLCDKYSLSHHTVRKYLESCAEFGLCQYDSSDYLNRGKTA